MAALVGSVLKAGAILRAFDRGHPRLTVRQIAAIAGIPKSTCHELCQTLVATGLLEPNALGGYQLGPALAVLSGQVTERIGLVDAAIDPVTTYLSSTRTEIHVAQYASGGIVYVLKVQNGRQTSNLNKTGRQWPLLGSACGWAVIAALPTEERSKFMETVPPSLRSRLVREVELYEKRGYLVTDVSQPGLTSVASAVFDHSAHVIGAIGTADSAFLMNSRRVAEIGSAIRQAAAAASRSLGFNPKPRRLAAGSN